MEEATRNTVVAILMMGIGKVAKGTDMAILGIKMVTPIEVLSAMVLETLALTMRREEELKSMSASEIICRMDVANGLRKGEV